MYTMGMEINCFGMEGNKVEGDPIILICSIQLASQHARVCNSYVISVLSCVPHLQHGQYMSMREYTRKSVQGNHMRE